MSKLEKVVEKYGFNVFMALWVVVVLAIMYHGFVVEPKVRADAMDAYGEFVHDYNSVIAQVKATGDITVGQKKMIVASLDSIGRENIGLFAKGSSDMITDLHFDKGIIVDGNSEDNKYVSLITGYDTSMSIKLDNDFGIVYKVLLGFLFFIVAVFLGILVWLLISGMVEFLWGRNKQEHKPKNIVHLRLVK